MIFFDLFKKKEKKVDSIDESTPTQFGTKLPIDVIYSLLAENYEIKGYEDGLCNFDTSYRNNNLAIIRNKIRVNLKQVKLKYEGMLMEIDYHIQLRKNVGLLDLVALLMSKKEIYDKHIEEIETMMEDLDSLAIQNTGSKTVQDADSMTIQADSMTTQDADSMTIQDTGSKTVQEDTDSCMMGIVKSYENGFARALAALRI